ncbi:IST1-like protein [Cavenderia fasciculata]|uniref:IST1-like protein n=1 Tax=Cavenderia fasciculata TaxID=261658 RepID=F4QFA3_CACFS|nr:IST1-like protein [Cavenderia fasciculata]EGG13410.1 IST1-like protein [Cavenderia fasciculata]|eukprot:XP_004350114.1 IST1-like protein [Cavenderia fasciculata]
MFCFGPHFDPHRCKVQLKLAVSRIQIQKTKKANLVKDEKRHIAELLRNRNEESARIRVETVIRDENLIECFNIIEVLCELVFTRLGLISASSSIPDEIKEAIYTLIYASQRVQIPELELIKKQLCAKYGKALENEVNCQCQTHVNPKIVHKLSYVTPEPFLIFKNLNDIACEFHVDWQVDPIVTAVSPTYIAAPPQQLAVAPPQQMMLNPMAPMAPPPQSTLAPPPFPTLVAPQHYQPPPPAYTASPQFPQAPQQQPINRTSSQPQFPSPPQYGSSHLSISATSSSPNFVSNQSNNQNFNIMNLPSPPTSFSSAPPPQPSNSNNQYPDFDDLTARFDALRRQNNDHY